MGFTINRDVVRITFEDSKEFRKHLRDYKIRFYNQLVDLLPSTYTDEAASANYSVHLLALAEEYARLHWGLQQTLSDVSFETLRTFLLYQNLGSLLGFNPDEDLSHEEYRKLLLGLLSILLGGARPENIQQGVQLFTTYEVKITEVFKVLDEIEKAARRSALNIADSVLTHPHDQCGGNLILNSEGLFLEGFMLGQKRLMFFVDILVLDAVNPKFLDKGGTLTTMLNMVKPAHTEFLLRHIFLEEFDVSDMMEEVYTKVELGILATATGSALNDPTDLLTYPMGPGTNLFILTDTPAIGFVPLLTFYV